MMKRYTAVLLLLLFTSSGSLLLAQRTASAPLRNTTSSHVTAHPPMTIGHHRTDPIWTDDFSNASNWTIGALNGTTDNWVIGTGVPAGLYAIPGIQSTSAANGFALFDSDVQCEVDNGYVATVSSIDLSSVAHVQLQFEQFYRRFQGHTFVDVSTNGSMWTSFEVNTQLTTGQYTANPELFTLDISSVAGSQSTVWLRFRYVGNCDYAWMVDDVALVEQPDHELSLVSAATTTWDFNTAATFDSVPYSVFPTTEIRPLAVNMTFFNAGYLPATNVVVHITTSDGYDESGSLGTVAPGDSVTWFGPLWTPTSTIGDHTIYYSLDSDDPDVDDTDNADTLKVAVSDFTFARDNGVREGETGDDGEAYLVGNWLHVQTAETLYGIDVAISSNSDIGVEVNAELLNDAREPIAVTGFHSITTSDLCPMGGSNFVSFIFDEPFQLDAGGDYFVAFQHFGGADVLVANSGFSIPQTSLLYRGSEDTWYSISPTPMVRMNFNPSIGIREVAVGSSATLAQNAPNPANSTTQIEVSLKRSANVSLELFDVNGKPVGSLAAGTMAPGTHRVDIDTRELEAGVYYYTLRTADGVATKRMVVVH